MWSFIDDLKGHHSTTGKKPETARNYEQQEETGCPCDAYISVEMLIETD